MIRSNFQMAKFSKHDGISNFFLKLKDIPISFKLYEILFLKQFYSFKTDTYWRPQITSGVIWTLYDWLNNS